MNANLNYVAREDVSTARDSEIDRQDLFNSLLGEIADALLDLGGSAHRDQVIDRVAVLRGLRAASEDLYEDLAQTFEHHRQIAAELGRAPILTLPFGEESRRWGLTAEAYDVLRLARHDRVRSQRLLRPLQSAAVFDLARARVASKQSRPRRSKASHA